MTRQYLPLLFAAVTLFCLGGMLTGCSAPGPDDGPGTNDNNGDDGNGPADSSVRVYGKVLDASNDEPLEDARITVAGVEGSVLTDEEGGFAFPLPAGGRYAVTATRTGYTYAQRWAEVNDGQLGAVRDMYLTPLDPSVIAIGREGGTGANSEGSIELDVPAGALSATVEMRATWFERGRNLPNDLPDLSHFTYACELSPDGQTFAEPATVRMRNTRGFAPGTPIPVGVYNSATLEWEPESMGVVSEDGEWVEFELTHFSPRDCNLGRRPPDGSGDAGDAEDISLIAPGNIRRCGSVSAGSLVGVADGQLLVDHVLPAYRRMGEWATVALQYDSSRVSTYPRLALSYDISQTSVELPDRVRFTVEIGGQRIERYFVPVEGSMQFSYRWDGRDGLGEEVPNGSYDYRMTLANEYPAEFATASVFGGEALNGTGVMADELIALTSEFSGTINLERTDEEEAPLGWGIAGVYRLTRSGDRVTIADGSTDVHTFVSGGDGFTASAGGFTVLTQTASGYEWLQADQSVVLFDSDGRQTALVDRNGNTTQFTYNSGGNLSSIVDPVGLTTTLAYDAGGDLSAITDPGGRTTQFVIDDGGDLVQVTNPDGTSRRFNYDDQHRMTTQTDAGGQVTRYTYDDAGAVTRVDRADGSHTEHVALGSQGSIGSLAGDVGTEANPASATNASYTDGAGNQWTYTVNSFGLRTSLTDPEGRVFRLERDRNNLLTAVWLPGERFYTYDYDERGRLTSTSGRSSTAYGIDLLRLTYDDAVDLPVTMIDDAVGTWENTYDVNGNLTVARLPDGREYTFTYNGRGQRTSVTIAGRTPTYTYDANGNLSVITDPARGTWALGYDGYGNLARVTDADGRTTTVVYDVMNLPTSFANGAGEEVRFTYAPAKGSEDLDGGGPVAVVTAVADGRGNQTEYDYDEVYNLVSETDPLGHETTFEHDGAGRITAMMEPTGSRVDFTYDGVGNLTAKTLSTGETYTYNYNEETGLLESATAPTCQATYTYNRFERISNITTAFVPDGPTVELDYTYRASNYFGSLFTMSVGAEYNELGYEYTGGQPLLPTDLYGGTWFWLGLEYDAAGRLSAWDEFYSSLDGRFEYDDADRLSAAEYTDYGGVTMFAAEWEYSSGGYLTAATFNGGRHEYGYDGAGRLIAASHPFADNPAEHYTYDASGNRREAGLEGSFEYDAANRLVRDPEFSYAYDASGNLIRKTETATSAMTQFAYDAENRLTGVSLADGRTISYAYDAFGRRVVKSAEGVVTQYVYESDEELAEFEDGVLVAQYVPGVYFDAPVGIRAGGFGDYDIYFYYTDALGTVQAIADAYGDVSSTCRYRSFGEPVEATRSAGGRLFAGRDWDEAAGLYYLRERFYDPRSGRFVQRDPLPVAGAAAPYAYAANSPTVARDPLGLEPQGEYGLRGLVNDRVVQPGKNAVISEGISRIPIGGSVGRAAYGQYNQWKTVIEVFGSRNPAEAGIRWYGRQWWNPAGSHLDDFLTLGGCFPRETARLQRIPGLRSGLRNYFGR